MLEILMLEECIYILHYLDSFDISYIIFKKIQIIIQIIKNCKNKYCTLKKLYLLKWRFQR
jgi:hypothetical protein